MLLKNDRTPALAYAAYKGSNADKNLANDDFITRMNAEGDDFGNFSSNAPTQKSKPSRNNQNRKKPRKSNEPAKKMNYKPFIFAGIAIIALVIIIALVVAIFNAPKSSAKISDTVYFTYIDENNEYHVVVNGDELKDTFKNEIELIPSADNSFAYILETVEEDVNATSGIRMHILQGKKLQTSVELADSVELSNELGYAYANLKPGIIYKRGARYNLYTGDSNAPITGESSAADFVISDDAKTVVYTIDSKKDSSVRMMKYFQGSGSKDMQTGFTPLAISSNGRYIYGTADKTGRFYYIDAKAKEIKPKAITNESYGSFGEITEMNADGNEIIFYTHTNKGIVSFYYKIKDKSPTTLAQGIFKSVSIKSDELYPSTFIGSYFVSQTSDIAYTDEGEVSSDATGNFATYCLKKDGAVKIANTAVKFSPDGKYFYYIDETSQLVRTPLSSTNYEENTENVLGYITEFALTEKGDVYMFCTISDKENDPVLLYYWDCSTKKSIIISDLADPKSMRICVNTLYFSETKSNNGESATTIYTSTDGSSKSVAEFKSTNLTKAPTIDMGIGKNGYAYVTDESTTMVFFTSTGKKFDLVCDSCTLPGAKSNTSGNSALG